MAQESRTEKWNPFGVHGISFFVLQVATSWTIFNLASKAAQNSDCPTLCVNVDETSISRSIGDPKGVVLDPMKRGAQKVIEQKNPNRGTLSFVAMICDNPSIQPRLPQFILGNEHILRVQDMQDIAETLPENVFLVRRKSSWVDHVFFCSVLELLRAAVSKVEPRMQIVMLLDASPVHTHDLVLRTAKRVHIRICFLPASSTWLLQPCDTHLFRKLKAGLTRLYRSYMVRNVKTAVPMIELLRMMVTLVRNVLQGTNWQDAFKHNGYGAEQLFTSTRVKTNLIENVLEQVSTDWPSDETIANMLPHRRKVNYTLLKDLCISNMELIRHPKTHETKTHWHARSSRTKRGSIPSDTCVDDEWESMTQNSQEPWLKRLRPRSHAGLPEVHAGSQDQEQPTNEFAWRASSSQQPCLSLMTPSQQHPPAPRVRNTLPQAQAMAMARKPRKA